jgi:hypothetical protein
MTDLEKAIERFKVAWVELHTIATPPSSVEEIVRWHKLNEHSYRGVRFVPGTGWVIAPGCRVDTKQGEHQHRLNVVLNEASQIEILTRTQYNEPDFW